MITLRLAAADFTPIRRSLGLLAKPDLGPLAEEARRIMLDDNASGILAGTDADGSTTAPLRPSTLRTRRGDGEPRAPQGSGSRIVSGYQVDISDTPLGGKLVVGTWPGFDAVRYFQTGTLHMVARNPVGLRPQAEANLQAAADKFAADLAGGV